MKTVQYTTTLDYYDGPLLFEARDAIGGHYLAVAVEAPARQDAYVVVGVPPSRLREFRAGLLDLRMLMEEASREEWFLTTATNLATPLELDPQKTPLEDTEFLPEEGFILHDTLTDVYVLKEAQARNNLVLELAVEPPEAATGHRIRVGTFVMLLDQVQKMVNHAYRAALRELPASYMLPVSPSEAAKLDVVVPAVAGSFHVILEASGESDLFGGCELARAMNRVDMLFEHAATLDAAVERVKQNQGHLAGAYLKLLQTLTREQTGLSYTWAEPTFTQPHSRSISAPEAGLLADALATVSNLAIEQVTLLGEFVKFNRNTGAWGLFTEDGLRSGKARDDSPSLDGLIVGQRYKFSCVEEIGAFEGTGREVRDLYLQEFEPA